MTPLEQACEALKVPINWKATNGRWKRFRMLLWESACERQRQHQRTANGTAPATTAAAGPALDPEDPSAMFQGFFTLPPHHTSSNAISPVANFAISTAPARCSLRACSNPAARAPAAPTSAEH